MATYVLWIMIVCLYYTRPQGMTYYIAFDFLATNYYIVRRLQVISQNTYEATMETDTKMLEQWSLIWTRSIVFECWLDMCSFSRLFGTFPETNIAPLNEWLEYDRFLLGPFGPSFRGFCLLLALESAEIPNQNQSQPTPTCDVKDLRFGVLTSWGPQIFIVSGELCECQDFSQGSGKWQPPKTTSKPVLLQNWFSCFGNCFFPPWNKQLYIVKKGEMRTSRTRRSSNTNLRRPSGSTLVYPSGSALVVDTQAPPVAQPWNIALWLARMMCTNFTKNCIYV